MIFICYSWADSVFVKEVNKYLVSSGNQTWIDFQNLNLGRPLMPQLSEAIANANRLIFIDSTNARLSSWVQLELLMANVTRTPVIRIPLRMHNRDIVGFAGQSSAWEKAIEHESTNLYFPHRLTIPALSDVVYELSR